MRTRTVCLFFIFLLISIDCGCIKKQQDGNTIFTMPSIKLDEKCKFITVLYGGSQINESFEIKASKEINDYFGVQHNCIESEYTNNYGLFAPEEYKSNVYIDGTTGTLIQINRTSWKETGIEGVIFYPRRSEALFSWLSFPALSVIARLSCMQGVELSQNQKVHRSWYGVNISYTLLGLEDINYLIEAQWYFVNPMDQSEVNVKEKYWMDQQTLFPTRVSTMVSSGNLTFQQNTTRGYYAPGTDNILSVCSADHNITRHPLAEFQKFDRYPPDGSECGLDLPLSSAVSEALNRSDGFRQYYEKHPSSYLWYGEYLIDDVKNANLSLRKNVSWNLTFVDSYTKTTYSISVYKEILLDNPLLSIISIRDYGSSRTDYDISQRKDFPSDIVTIQSSVDITKTTLLFPSESKLRGITWYATLSPLIDGWLFMAWYIEERGTYPYISLYNIFVGLSPISGALVGWNRFELRMGQSATK